MVKTIANRLSGAGPEGQRERRRELPKVALRHRGEPEARQFAGPRTPYA